MSLEKQLEYKISSRGRKMIIENKVKQYEQEISTILAKLAYHIDPLIIREIQEYNKQDYAYFENIFKDKININDYMFSGSACVFPGVRRYTRHNGEKTKYNSKYKAIIDDNTFPRHIWCYLINGKVYNNNNWIETGLDEFELAHIFSHKKNEIDIERNYFKEYKADVLPYGLFTCAANVILLPKGTVRPTDNSKIIKSIFYKRFIDLYGESLLPGRSGFKHEEIPVWYSKLTWNKPILPEKWEEKIKKLMIYRKKRISQILSAKT